MKGHFAPGDVVTLRSLADAFGTSPMPVRAALSRLVAEQAFVVRPNRSMIVPLLSAERLDEIRRTIWAIWCCNRRTADRSTSSTASNG